MYCKYTVLAATLLVLGALLTGGAYAWEINESADVTRIKGRIDLSEYELSHQQVRGFDLIEIEGGRFLTDPGAPMLPVIQVKIALPAGQSASAVRLMSGELVSMSGSFEIMPVQPPHKVSARRQEAPWTLPDPAIYTSDTAYPTAPVRLTGETDLAGQAMALVELCPLSYSPRRGELALYHTMELELECTAGRIPGDQVPASASLSEIDALAEMLREEVVNPDHVVMPVAMGMGSGARLEAGDYDYIIITRIDLAANFEPLADWKTQKGVPAKIVTAGWIYDQPEYTGSDEERIRAFIIDAHNTWGADYFLIGGDTNQIPCHWWTTPVEPYIVPNDTYYGDFDDDWTVEVHVGRAPVRYLPDVYYFVNKVLTYEKNPPLTDYAQEILLLGFDLDNDTPGEIAQQYIDANYVPAGWNATCIYDSDPGQHKDTVIAACDAGQNLTNHIDHSDTHEMGVGSVHHDQYLLTTDVNAFANGDRIGTVYSLGCWANNYESQACIGETFVKTTGGGGVAFIGNSRYGWYNPGLTSTLSFRYDRYFFRSLFEQGHTILGEAFSDHKHDSYQSENTSRYIFKELTLIGDPELPIWMNDPQSLTIDCPPTMITGADDFTVHVAADGGGSLAGARVCLWKSDDVYLIAFTDAGGAANFAPNPQSTGTLLVTVTKPDYLPGECEVIVGDHSAIGYESVPRTISFLARPSHNPFRGATQIRYALAAAGPVDLAVYDMGGRLVRTLIAGARDAGEHTVAWDGRDNTGQDLPAGVYLYQMRSADYQKTRRTVMLP